MKRSLTSLIKTLAWAPAVAGMAFSLSAIAQEAPKAENPLFASNSERGPVEISADQLEVRQPDQLAIFTGNVVAIQGDLNLKSDRMTVHYRGSGEQKSDKESVSRIDVDGNVFIANPSETASGDKGIYDVDNNEIRLLGNVTLTRAENILKGSSLIYNLDTGKSVLSKADGSKSSGRVRALFVPNKKDDK